MVRINYPEHDFRIQEKDGTEIIFDEFRKRWVALTPEEWVRQNTLQYLTRIKQYPPSLIAIEKEIWLSDIKKRFDILVYRNSLPWMVIECKEMNVPISEQVLRQALQYNIALKTRFLVITNGVDIYVFLLKDGNAEMMDAFPEWGEEG